MCGRPLGVSACHFPWTYQVFKNMNSELGAKFIKSVKIQCCQKIFISVGQISDWELKGY